MGALSDVVERVLGVETKTRDWIADVSTIPSRILTNNPDRLEVVIVNSSANNAYLGLTSDVAVGKGLVVPNGNGSVVLTARDDGEMVGREWWVVSDAAIQLYVLVLEAK